MTRCTAKGEECGTDTRMPMARCIAEQTEMLLTEAQGKGSLKNGGRLTVSCRIELPDAVEN